MKPLQVYLSEAELQRLSTWAERKGWTKSHAVRVAIRALVRSTDREKNAFLSSSGMITGLPSDLSENFDAYLNETFVAESPASYRARRSRSPIKGRRRKNERPGLRR
jgi:hypothetical protein